MKKIQHLVLALALARAVWYSEWDMKHYVLPSEPVSYIDSGGRIRL